MSQAENTGALFLGALLRRERERRGVTVADVAREIRVGSRQIEAIENGRYQALPPHPYVKGFLGAYSEYLNLDPVEVFRLYEAAVGQTAPEKNPARPRLFRYPEEEKFHWRDWTIPITLAVGAGVFLVSRAFLLPGQTPLPELSSLPTPAVVMAPVAPAINPEGMPAAGAPASEPAIETNVKLLFKSEGDTWVTAAADGGEEKRYPVRPGQNLELRAREKLGVALGDAGLIRITCNDRELGFIGLKGETKSGLLFVAPKAKPAMKKTGPGAGETERGRAAPAGD